MSAPQPPSLYQRWQEWLDQLELLRTALQQSPVDWQLIEHLSATVNEQEAALHQAPSAEDKSQAEDILALIQRATDCHQEVLQALQSVHQHELAQGQSEQRLRRTLGAYGASGGKQHEQARFIDRRH